MAVQRDAPYMGFNFTLDLGTGVAAGFSEVSGLSHELDLVEYREGTDRRNTPRLLVGLHRVGEVTLKRGVSGNLELFQWMREAVNGAPSRRNLTLHLLAEDRSVAMTWKLINALPMKLTHGPFLAADSDVAIEELVIAAEALEIE